MAAGRQPARPNFEFRISNFEFRISRASPRRGVSLLEVLISMFVMLFGLMGVAAIFPVGNHYAVRGERFDRGAAAIDVAVADLKARGVLDTRAWLYADANNTPLMNYDGVFNPSTRRIRGPAFLIDPLGASMVDPGQGLPMFPYGGDGGSVNPWGLLDETGDPLGWPIRRVSLRQRGQDFRLSTIAAELIATLRDDVTVDVPRDADRPSVVRWNIVNGV
ncbi:MAG TPA: prepilin-type N-terminal cleavage/methylation domain-containing protein, partial [Lacipirellulaceae bacterium]|nr:prepilin-type N-terminal cleavage/methylation domain-containing protein [Lacipirellulaceae bacterium]